MVASLANVSGQTGHTRSMSSSSPISRPEVDLSEKKQPQNQQSEELASMKIELAQLRQLVFQMREHHIESSFKDDDAFHEDHVKPSLQNIQTAPTPANDIEDPHMSIKFERKSTPTEEKGPPLSGKRRRAVSKSIN
jgi:TolA-binding protein